MRWLNAFLFAVLLLLPMVASAQESGRTLVITKAGYFLLVQDADGIPSLVKIDHVIKLDEPPPVDPTDPTDPPAVKFRAAVKEATAAVPAVTDEQKAEKARTKVALSKLYATISGLPVTSREDLHKATTVIFNALELPGAWHQWKAAVESAADSFAGADVNQLRAAWSIIAETLEAN